MLLVYAEVFSVDVVLVSDVCQAITLLLSLFAYVPQWLSLKRSQSSKNISLGCWLMWAFSPFLSLSYASVQFLVRGHRRVEFCPQADRGWWGG